MVEEALILGGNDGLNPCLRQLVGPNVDPVLPREEDPDGRDTIPVENGRLLRDDFLDGISRDVLTGFIDHMALVQTPFSATERSDQDGRAQHRRPGRPRPRLHPTSARR
jgi:hypothetical protein